jgi:predicted Zn-dependent peptidase
MINFEEFSLDNGLKVIVHEDHSLPIAVLNILYNVGSRDESEDKTGFAHLFEHLMFGGSANIKSFDEPLQKVGGENNAFTSPDITNYYISIPAANLETAFWLESDRMFSLSFEEKVLEIQRKVVIEEFKQRYLNQPYGDVWLKLRPLAYKTHPYKWATIGKDISHIETASLEDVTSFFNKFYIPNNATMVVAGDVNAGEVIKLADKWFGDIPDGKRYIRQLPMEPAQLELRRQEIEANVPLDAIYMAFHMPGRFDNDYYTADLISDILGKGKTSRLYQRLVKDKNIFTSINAYVTGSVDPGLLVISGKIKNSITPEFAEHEINDIIEEFMDKGTSMQELQKVKNQAYTSLAFQDVELLNRAMNLAYFSNMGDPNLVNREKSRIESVSIDNMLSVGRKILKKSNRSVLNYNSRK